MTQATDTLFRYEPRGWLAFLPHFSGGWAILMIASMNGTLVATLVVAIVNPVDIEFPVSLLLGIGVLVMTPVCNLFIFSLFLLYADLELTPEQVIVCFSRYWKLPINLHDLHSIRIQKRAVWGANILGPADHEYAIYFISSPNLPWYFRFGGLAGHPPRFTGRGFFITSWHENYEAFLGEMRAYEAQ